MLVDGLLEPIRLRLEFPEHPVVNGAASGHAVRIGGLELPGAGEVTVIRRLMTRPWKSTPSTGTSAACPDCQKPSRLRRGCNDTPEGFQLLGVGVSVWTLAAGIIATAVELCPVGVMVIGVMVVHDRSNMQGIPSNNPSPARASGR